MAELTRDYQKQIGNLIQTIRRLTGKTQLQFSELCVMNLRHYQKIEAGLVSIRLETLAKILQVAGFSFSTFFSLLESDCIQKQLTCRRISQESLQSIGTLIQLIKSTSSQRFEDDILEEIYHFDHLLRKQDMSRLDSIKHHVVEFDDQLECIWGNKEAHEFFGNDLVGSLGNRYFCETNEADLCRTEFSSIAAKQKNLFVREIHYNGQGGRKKIAAVWGHPVKTQGSVTKILSIGVDITEHRKAHYDLTKVVKNRM